MQSLRIALALLGFIVVWFVLLPADPTLLNPSQAPIAEAALDDPATTSAVPASEPAVTAARPEANPAIRSIIPSPLTQGGDLKRMPPAASGAATPIEAAPPGRVPSAAPTISTATAGLPEPTTPEPTPSSEVAATTSDDGKPNFQMFNRPVAVDSGTIRAGETTLRVAGVEPIAPEARCASGTQSWPCGVRARTAFRAWLRGRSLLCTVPSDSQDSRDLTVPCLLGEEDVGAWLVSNGWAAASAGSRYKPAETEAKNARRGIWAFQIEG